MRRLIAGLVIAGIVAAVAACGSGSTASTSPALTPTPTHVVGSATPSPFLYVLNENDPDITISPWDGAPLTTLSCPNDVSFQLMDGPASPWHYVVRDATSGQILHEDTISDDGHGFYIVEARDGQILRSRDILPSGPINPSRKPCPNVSP
jgi:hypothetical protein